MEQGIIIITTTPIIRHLRMGYVNYKKALDSGPHDMTEIHVYWKGMYSDSISPNREAPWIQCVMTQILLLTIEI